MARAVPTAALVLSAALLLATPQPSRALAALSVPPNGISECAVFAAGGAGVTTDPADFLPSFPSPDRLEVTAVADASDGLSVPGLYEGSMAWSCILAGSGAVEYGSLAGSASIEASSTPDFLPPTPNNEPNTFTNNGYGAGDLLLTLQFDDTATVVSDTLPNGTPVQLEFEYSLQSTAVLVGRPLGEHLAAAATYFPSAVDTAAPGAPASAILSGSQIVTRTLDTAVGHTINLQGQLQLRAIALAGREVPGALYYPQASASVEASNSAYFRLVANGDVRLDAESGQDYAAVPAPAQAPLALTGVLVLWLSRWRAWAPS
jgi:hypothetical protein